jgi:hypothetical protein
MFACRRVVSVWRWFVIALMFCGPAWAQDKSAPSAVRSAVLALQQMSVSVELLAGHYEARIAELEKLCGEPCKPKAEAK